MNEVLHVYTFQAQNKLSMEQTAVSTTIKDATSCYL
jgi:hypothetical protein